MECNRGVHNLKAGEPLQQWAQVMYFCNGFKVVQIVAFVSVTTWVYGNREQECFVRYGTFQRTAQVAAAIRTLVVMGQPYNLDKADYSSAIFMHSIPVLGAEAGCRNNEQQMVLYVPDSEIKTESSTDSESGARHRSQTMLKQLKKKSRTSAPRLVSDTANARLQR
jgi:hypothetical protein